MTQVFAPDRRRSSSRWWTRWRCFGACICKGSASATAGAQTIALDDIVAPGCALDIVVAPGSSDGIDGYDPHEDTGLRSIVPETALAAGPDGTAVLDEAGLNPRYTFETFVKGSSNHFALAEAFARLGRRLR